MLGIDAAMGTWTVPIWVGGAASAVFAVVIMVAMGRSGSAALINALFRVAIAAVAVAAGWYYMQRMEQQDHAAARRLLDERSAALMAHAIAPGSALSCLDELAGETVEIACENAVFATPEAVSAAVLYVAAKLALLEDGSDHAQRADAAFAAELAPLRNALELDRFGIVAHVLAERNGCTADRCDALARFADRSRVLANLRDRTFDGRVTKAAAFWHGSPHAMSEGAAVATAAPPASPPQYLGPAPATVSPRYDFPSSQSIPPVNIMVPEQSAPRAGAAPGGQPAAASGNGNSPAAGGAARRPPPPRAPAAAAASRQSGQRPAAPASGEPSTDGAVPRASAPLQLQPQ